MSASESQLEIGLSFWKPITGIFYGGLLAGTLVVFRELSSHGGLPLYTYSALLAWLLHLVAWPTLTLQSLKKRPMVIRGLLFALTQVLFFRGQEIGSTSDALVASLLGTISSMFLIRIVLRERPSNITWIAAAISVLSLLANPSLMFLSAFALLSGIVQGLSTMYSTKLMITREKRRTVVSTSCFFAAIIGLTICAVQYRLNPPAVYNYSYIVTGAALILMVQYSFYSLIKLLGGIKVSTLSLSRIPWALGFERFIVGRTISLSQLTSAGCISFAMIILILESIITDRARKASPSPSESSG